MFYNNIAAELELPSSQGPSQNAVRHRSASKMSAVARKDAEALHGIVVAVPISLLFWAAIIGTCVQYLHA